MDESLETPLAEATIKVTEIEHLTKGEFHEIHCKHITIMIFDERSV